MVRMLATVIVIVIVAAGAFTLGGGDLGEVSGNLIAGDIEDVDTEGNTVTVQLAEDHSVLGVGLVKPNGDELQPSKTRDVGSAQTEVRINAELYRSGERDDGWKIVAYGDGYGDWGQEADVIDTHTFEFTDDEDDGTVITG